MPESLNKKLERLKTKKEKILEEMKLVARQMEEKDKKYLSKKIEIVGKFFMDKYKNKMEDLKQMLDPVLKKVSDRKMFGLSHKKEPQKQQNSSFGETPSSQQTTSCGKGPFWKK